MSKISLKHSGGKVVSLNSPTTEPNENDVAFKLPNADGSDGQAIVTDGSGNLSFGSVAATRNLIINGAMQVAQRGTSSTGNLYQTIDRIRTSSGNLGSINLTQSQQQLASSDTPYSSGFRYFYRAALSGAGTVNANGYIGISQRLEAQDIAQSGWNYTSASSNITLQFWFRCSTNQTFYGILETSNGTPYSYPFAFTASGNNAWTKITKTIPGNSNLQFDLNADRGLKVGFTPWYGTDYTGSKTADAWSPYSGSAEYPDYASTWLTAGASTFDITGVQLEVGSVATDFEHRSFAQELNLCTRYFQKLQPTTVGGANDNPIAVMANFTTTHAYGRIPFFNGIMRTGPSLTTSGCSYYANTNSYTGLTFAVGGQSESSMEVNVTASSGNWVTGHAGWIRGGSFELSAEL